MAAVHRFTRRDGRVDRGARVQSQLHGLASRDRPGAAAAIRRDAGKTTGGRTGLSRPAVRCASPSALPGELWRGSALLASLRRAVADRAIAKDAHRDSPGATRAEHRSRDPLSAAPPDAALRAKIRPPPPPGQ